MRPDGAEPRVQSIARAKAILDVLAANEGRWTALKDIAAAVGLLKTTTFNIVSALTDVDLVERDAGQGRYRLGLQALVYGRAVERRLDLVALMRPHLVRLCGLTRETVNLAVPCPTDVLIVESMEGMQSLRVSSYAGTRAAYHSTACGRAILAFRPPAEQAQILSLGPLAAPTPLTTVDPAAIAAILSDCRRDGYVSEVEENELGAACVAAPLYDAAGEVIAAVSVAGPISRMNAATRERFGALLVTALAEAGRELRGDGRGGRP